MVCDLEYFGGERNDLHVGGAEFAGYGAEDTSAAEFAGVVKQYTCIVVETDI